MRAAGFAIDREFAHLPQVDLDGPTRRLLFECVDAQRSAFARASERGDVTFAPDPDPRTHASDDALGGILARGVDVSDVRTNDTLGNCLVFHTDGLAGSIVDPEVVGLRQQIDALVPELLATSFDIPAEPDVVASGHLWYPPGGYIGWHTNSRVPGWRAYLTWVDEPARSAFRHLDPISGEIQSSPDDGWDLRVFRVDVERPLWHTVWSETDRFSFGYRILERDAA